MTVDDQTTPRAIGAHLTLATSIAKLAASRMPAFVELFAHGTLSVELYAPLAIDGQSPHDRDEVYVVASGHGEFLCAGVRSTFATGDLLFVPAHVEHRFENFSSDFSTWVMFYGPVGGESRG
jgi:mannose-6-phosphate isomerase-like protein (cupin superfamily)